MTKTQILPASVKGVGSKRAGNYTIIVGFGGWV